MNNEKNKFAQQKMTLLQVVFKTCLAAFFMLVCFSSLDAQTEISKSDTTKERLESNTVREEIQRYIGYEALLYKFVTLPFDVTMGTNVKGTHTDIGFLFLALLPLLLLSKKLAFGEKSLLALLLILMLTAATTIIYSNQYFTEYKGVKERITLELTNPHIQGTIIPPTIKTTRFLNPFFVGVHQLLGPYTGDKDWITLPILLGIALWLIYLFFKVTQDQNIYLKSLLLTSLIYGFLWFFLCLGIIWYGILVVPLGFAFIFSSLKHQPWWISIFAYGFGFLWLMMAFVYRLANYTPYNETLAKGLIDQQTIRYQSGSISQNTYMDTFFPKYALASEKINREDQSLIFLTGTMLPFFIEKSDRRIITDTQLSQFRKLIYRFPDKIQLVQAMKAYGIRYLVTSFHLHKMDKTPEQTLAKKHSALMEFVTDNPLLTCIATDRTFKNQNGKEVMGVVGDTLRNVGTFALYELE